MPPKHLFFHLFFCARTSRNVNICQYCIRIYVLDDRYPANINVGLVDVYSQKKKSM